MAILDHPGWLVLSMTVIAMLLGGNDAIDIYLDWDVALDNTISPVSMNQPVITINGMFPGPLINATTNDFIHVNVHNNLDEPLLFTWNGIQQRLNSWQDGVSGTNCPIQAGANWTYVFQTKDQIGTFFYFPSINYQKAAGGYGPIRVNNRNVILVPFDKPEEEFDLLIGDWSYDSYKSSRSSLDYPEVAYHMTSDTILMNGKGPYGHPMAKAYESFTVTKGKTYLFRISNVGSELSLNFRIANHKMVVVETEGSYTSQIALDSLDIHVGQSYSVLVTADQDEADYYIVATPKLINVSDSDSLVGKGVLHYSNSGSKVGSSLPSGPDPFNVEFSIDQAKSIRWNMTTGAARPNPQGTFNVTNVTISQTFILQNSPEMVGDSPRFAVNNVSYYRVSTPLKLADYFLNGSGVYQLDAFPIQTVNAQAGYLVSVVSGNHKGWLEVVFKNNLDVDVMDSWHLDGFGFYVVGFGDGDWTADSRSSYNLLDPVVRSTVQVYPGKWTAVYAFLDNPGMWNLRSQHLKHWYLGQELYIRVHDPDPNPARERLPPDNLLLCGVFADPGGPSPAPVAAPSPASGSEW